MLIKIKVAVALVVSQALLKSHTWLHNSFVTIKQIREYLGCEL